MVEKSGQMVEECRKWLMKNEMVNDCGNWLPFTDRLLPRTAAGTGRKAAFFGAYL